ncbi:uncharacterized protein LOC141708354 [Apium graveolens]|uniref:uncharacterized protein LOC141708354 n=1 Tax=Apium graveolens TaxID=4045 RepID=UPI003D7A8149
MGDQRQRFSFRLPWSAPPAPTRRPAPVTNNPPRAISSNDQTNANPTTTSQKSPSQSSGSSQTPKALPRASTSTKTSPKSTPTGSPTVTPQSAIKTKNPASPSTSPRQPIAESQRPSVTTTQPIRPATQTSPLRSPEQLVERNSPLRDQAPTKQQPSSTSPANFQSRTSLLSRAGTQRRATSESPPPSNVSPQSRPPSRKSIKSPNTSQSPLTSHSKSSVSETDSQPLSPARSQQKNSSSAVYQPRSPPSPENNLSEKVSKNMQPIAGIPTPTGSPSKISNPTDSIPPSLMSNNVNHAMPQSQPQAHPEKDITDEMVSKAPIEATIKPNAVASSQQSDPLSSIPNPIAAEEMTEKYKEVMHSNPLMLYGKQSKGTASHQSNKNKEGASRQKPMASNGEGISMQKEIKNDISKLTQKMATEQGKAVSIITLVGENKGATMQLGSPKEGAVHIHRGYKLNPNESTEAITNGEESAKEKRPKEANTKEQMTKAYMNSNSQGINNSIVFKSSITERNPGVHLNLTQTPTEPIKTTAKADQLVAHKAEASVTPSQKLTYETTIRRRCLRGLLMESSDSDPDNSEKPRRHGCRCSYGDMNKDKEIDLL